MFNDQDLGVLSFKYYPKINTDIASGNNRVIVGQ